ncbi:hypothetical protein, partial [Paenibacillus xylanexedens]
NKIEHNLLTGKINKAQEIHDTIQSSMLNLREIIKSHEDYVLLMSGCDDILIGTNCKNILEIEKYANFIRLTFQNLSNETLSTGIGKSIIDCLVNLRIAKISGKNIVVK